MAERVLDRLRATFGAGVLATHSQHGDDTAVLRRDLAAAAARFLRDEPELDFDHPIDLTCVDYLPRAPRFEVVVHLRSTRIGHRVRLKFPVPAEEAALPSLTPIYPGLSWFEREVWDLFGVRFHGHPDLRRIFLWDEFEGHPLRKDYPKERRQPLARRKDPQ